MSFSFAQRIRDRLNETGQSIHGAAVAHGLPRDALRTVLAGHDPRLSRAIAICEALDLELYIGPPRVLDIDEALRREVTHDASGSLVAVRDHEIAAVVTSLIDEYEAMNSRGRRSLLKRFWELFPDLRGRESAAGIVAWLGWRAVEARRRTPDDGCG